MPPQLLIGGAIWAASVGLAVWWGYGLGADHEVAAHAREKSAAVQAGEAAASAAAEAISRLEVKHVQIRQRTEQTIREVPVYRDCRHDDRVMRDINAARTGAEPAPADDSVPAASAPH